MMLILLCCVITALVSEVVTKQDERHSLTINNSTPLSQAANISSRLKRDLKVDDHFETDVNTLQKETFSNESTLTIRVTEGIEKVTTYWTFHQSGTGLTGFIVTYRNEKREHFDSPVLDSQSREFALPQLDKELTYTICVHAMVNQSELQQACTDLQEQSLKIVVGIMAGVVFLIPCVIALVWLLRKDKKMMKDDQPLLPCAITTENSVQQTNLQQNEASKSNVVVPHGYVNIVYKNSEENATETTLSEGSTQVKLYVAPSQNTEPIISQPSLQKDSTYSVTDINIECPTNESVHSLDTLNKNNEIVTRMYGDDPEITRLKMSQLHHLSHVMYLVILFLTTVSPAANKFLATLSDGQNSTDMIHLLTNANNVSSGHLNSTEETSKENTATTADTLDNIIPSMTETLPSGLHGSLDSNEIETQLTNKNIGQEGARNSSSSVGHGETSNSTSNIQKTPKLSGSEEYSMRSQPEINISNNTDTWRKFQNEVPRSLAVVTTYTSTQKTSDTSDSTKYKTQVFQQDIDLMQPIWSKSTPQTGIKQDDSLDTFLDMYQYDHRTKVAQVGNAQVVTVNEQYNNWNFTKLTITLLSHEDSVTAMWSFESNDTQVTGFLVTYRINKREHYDSSKLGKNVRSFTLHSLHEDEDYVICVHAMVNTTAVKESCAHWNEASMKIVVGIMAGILFLIPCVCVVVWILVKDRRVRHKMACAKMNRELVQKQKLFDFQTDQDDYGCQNRTSHCTQNELTNDQTNCENGIWKSPIKHQSVYHDSQSRKTTLPQEMSEVLIERCQGNTESFSQSNTETNGSTQLA
ncbi:hypothetical protein Btru_013808 [Bulinus truncatus]|nr:hypothetical protein Btru_013808 [Bulinus truncatus]